MIVIIIHNRERACEKYSPKKNEKKNTVNKIQK